MAISIKGPQTKTFQREEIEHAHTSVIRLRELLRTLAKISVTNLASDRGSCMTVEATDLLNVIGCVIQATTGEKGQGGHFVHSQLGIPPDRVRHLAANLKSRVLSAGSSVVIQNLRQQFPNELWLVDHDVHSYMGVPVFGADESINAVAAVFGGRNRTLGEEDDWWLRTAGRMVSDLLAFEAQALELGSLDRVVVPSEAGGAAATPAKAPAPKPTILVIDDDRTINDLICELLTMEGYEVESAFNGVEAIQAFQPSKHALAITDVAMPLMNGWELIAALRVRSPALPIILISGYQTGEWNQAYLTKQGVSAVLNKPLNLDQLTGLVAKLVPISMPAAA